MKAVVALVLALAIGGAVGAWTLRSRAQAPFKGYEAPEVFVSIPSGSSTAAIGRSLIDAGVIRDDLTFRVALWLSGDARRLKAGEYQFAGSLTPADVLGKIARGEVAQVSITIREGLTIAEMAAVVEARGLATAAAFTSAARNAALITAIDPQATDLEGYLFPETYSLPRKADAAQLVQAMVDRFAKVLTPEMRAAATARGLSVRQLVTLASIVEKETGNTAERAEVAAVYVNRLRIGMALQCDPTVIYALQKAGRFDGNLRRDDLQFDSPYNTYRYPGLPPGPIAAPGKASLDAALQPADGKFLYFVSRNDGTHAFAETLDEHNRNVQRFQIQYFRQRRLANRGR